MTILIKLNYIRSNTIMHFAIDNNQSTLYRFNIEVFKLELFYLNLGSIWHDESSLARFLKDNNTAFTITNLTVNPVFMDNSSSLITLEKLKFGNERVYIACDNNSSSKYFVTTKELVTFAHFFENWNIHHLSAYNAKIFNQLETVQNKLNSLSNKKYQYGEIFILLTQQHRTYSFANIRDFWNSLIDLIRMQAIDYVIGTLRGNLYMLLVFSYDLIRWFQVYMSKDQYNAPLFLTPTQQQEFNSIDITTLDLNQYSLSDDLDPSFYRLLIDFFDNIKVFKDHHNMI